MVDRQIRRLARYLIIIMDAPLRSCRHPPSVFVPPPSPLPLTRYQPPKLHNEILITYTTQQACQKQRVLAPSIHDSPGMLALQDGKHLYSHAHISAPTHSRAYPPLEDTTCTHTYTPRRSQTRSSSSMGSPQWTHATVLSSRGGHKLRRHLRSAYTLHNRTMCRV